MKRFAADERGATSIEYGLIAVIIGVGLVSAITALGNPVVAMFETVNGLFP